MSRTSVKVSCKIPENMEFSVEYIVTIVEYGETLGNRWNRSLRFSLKNGLSMVSRPTNAVEHPWLMVLTSSLCM